MSTSSESDSSDSSDSSSGSSGEDWGEVFLFYVGGLAEI